MLYSMNRNAKIESGQGGQALLNEGVMEQLVVSVLTSTSYAQAVALTRLTTLLAKCCASATYDVTLAAQRVMNVSC